MIKSVNLYSPIAMVAAMPSTAFQTFLSPTAVTVRSATHHIVGLTDEESGVLDPLALRIFFVQQLYMSSVVNESQFTLGLPPPVRIKFKNDGNEESRSAWNDIDEWDFSEILRERLHNDIMQTAWKDVTPRDLNERLSC
jgi:hypothetical protein